MGLQTPFQSLMQKKDVFLDGIEQWRRPGSGAPCLAPIDVEFAGQPLDLFQFRSKDIRYSPSGTRVAVVSTNGGILLFTTAFDGSKVIADLLTHFVSKDLQKAHGVDWADEEHLVVANRGAALAFFKVPIANRWEPETRISALSIVQPSWFGKPGEVCVKNGRTVATGANSVRCFDGKLIAGCTKGNTVTQHGIKPGPSCDDGELIAHDGVNIPDSAVVSQDRKWLAIGNHEDQNILIFRLGQKSPVARLTDPDLFHPHGLVFDQSGTVLISTDAGGRRLHVFHAPDGDWEGDQTLSASKVVAVPRTVFNRVQMDTPEAVRALEGGTKGIDLCKKGRIVLTTCRGLTVNAFLLHA